MSYHILLTIDVEDWFHVENFKQCIPFSSWPSCKLRVEKNTHKILDLLDSQKSEVRGQRSISTNPTNPINSQLATRNSQPVTKNRKPMPSNQQPASSNQIRATFFVLGWIAERLPHLVREIHARGHEVASHGYYHNLCNQQSPDALKKDLTDSKKLLEDIVSAPISGYRAPSFSIDKDILKIIKDCGYLYDSSYNSFSMHGRYGRLNLSQNARKGIALQIPAGHKSPPSTHYQQPASSNEQRATINQHPVTSIEYQSSIFNLQSSILFELPISNLKLGNHIIPWGGGAYFRLIPSSILFTGVKAILRKHNAYLLYLHPWELDPQQPKVKDAGTFHRVRHYTNLDKTHSKLFRLVQSFEHCNFVTCSQYLSTISQELSPMSYEL